MSELQTRSLEPVIGAQWSLVASGIVATDQAGDIGNSVML